MKPKRVLWLGAAMGAPTVVTAAVRHWLLELTPLTMLVGDLKRPAQGVAYELDGQVVE